MTLLKLIFFLILFYCTSNICAQDKYAHVIQMQEMRLQKNPNDTQALKELGFIYLYKADYQKALTYGERLFNIGYKTQDYNNKVMYAHIILGQAHMALGDSVAYNHLGQAKLAALSSKNDSALCSIYNGMGLYASNIDNDNYSAIHYFFQGIDAAKRCNYKRLHAILLANIAAMYFLQRDTVGLPYSLEAYHMGHEQASPYLTYIGASTTSYMYYLQKNYTKALQYIKEAEFLMLQNNFYDQGNVYAIYGLILSAQNHIKEAITLFKKGLDLKEKKQTSSKVLLLCGYAKALIKQKSYKTALEALHEALNETKKKNCHVFRNDVINALAECYEQSGQHDKALTWFHILLQENNRIFNKEQEKIISDLRIKYNAERQENEIKQSKLILLKKKKNEQLLICMVIVILFIAINFWYQYKKKEYLYTSIVRQNQEAMQRELKLKKHIEQLQKGYQDDNETYNEKYAVSSLSNKKKQLLFQQLEYLMQKQNIYKDNLLTKEKVAEILHTNRTYLSQTINEQTEQNFTQYINSYRIAEAIRLLNDPLNNMPLKAISAEVGFNSMTTFYKLFQNQTGIPPKQYREKVLQLQKKA